MSRLRRFAPLAAALVLAACGYRLVGTASNIPPEIRKVYLKPLENSTGRVQVDQILTRALADERIDSISIGHFRRRVRSIMQARQASLPAAPCRAHSASR